MSQQTDKLDSIIPDTEDWPILLRVMFFAMWLIIGVGLVWMAKSVWWLIGVAFIIGYLLQPLIALLVKVKVPRSLAAVLSLLLVLVVISLLPIILVPALFADIAPISIDYRGLFLNFVEWVQTLPDLVPSFGLLGYEIDLTPFYEELAVAISSINIDALLPAPADLAKLVQDVVSSTARVVTYATNLATNVIGLSVSIVFSLILLILLSFYIATDLPKLAQRILNLAPASIEAEWRMLWRRTAVIWSSFFRGQIILSLVIGVSVWLGMSFIGVPGALVLGVLSGIFEIIPNLGPILAAIPGIALALLQGSINYPDTSNLTIALVVLGFYILIQQAENLFLVPRILGQSVGIHPALVLVAVLVFTIQLGILGAFIATPAVATIQLWFHYFHARLVGRRPFPELDSGTSPPTAHAPPMIEPGNEEPDQEADDLPQEAIEEETQTLVADEETV